MLSYTVATNYINQVRFLYQTPILCWTKALQTQYVCTIRCMLEKQYDYREEHK